MNTPIRRTDAVSQNTLNLVRVANEANTQSQKPKVAVIGNKEMGRISLAAAIMSKRFTDKGMGVYKEATQDDIGKIWVKKTFVENGKAQDWLVVYTTDEGEIVRQAVLESLQENVRLRKVAAYESEEEADMDLSGGSKKVTDNGFIEDDLKSNFRSWETGENANVTDAESLYHQLMERHPNESPARVIQLAYDWVGVSYDGMASKHAFLPSPHSCESCEHFQHGHCLIAEQVVQEHGQDKLRQWVDANMVSNGCSLFDGNQLSPSMSETSSLKFSEKVNPKDLPIAPGIKGKDLTMKQDGATQTADVTVHFTDTQQALKFYQEQVAPNAPSSPVPPPTTEAPKQDEGKPQQGAAPAGPQQPTNAPQQGGGLQQPKASSLKREAFVPGEPNEDNNFLPSGDFHTDSECPECKHQGRYYQINDDGFEGWYCPNCNHKQDKYDAFDQKASSLVTANDYGKGEEKFMRMDEIKKHLDNPSKGDTFETATGNWKLVEQGNYPIGGRSGWWVKQLGVESSLQHQAIEEDQWPDEGSVGSPSWVTKVLQNADAYYQPMSVVPTEDQLIDFIATTLSEETGQEYDGESASKMYHDHVGGGDIIGNSDFFSTDDFNEENDAFNREQGLISSMNTATTLKQLVATEDEFLNEKFEDVDNTDDPSHPDYAFYQRIKNGELYEEYYSPSESTEYTDGQGNWFNHFGQELRDPSEYDPTSEGYTPFGDEGDPNEDSVFGALRVLKQAAKPLMHRQPPATVKDTISFDWHQNAQEIQSSFNLPSTTIIDADVAEGYRSFINSNLMDMIRQANAEGSVTVANIAVSSLPEDKKQEAYKAMVTYTVRLVGDTEGIKEVVAVLHRNGFDIVGHEKDYALHLSHTLSW